MSPAVADPFATIGRTVATDDDNETENDGEESRHASQARSAAAAPGEPVPTPQRSRSASSPRAESAATPAGPSAADVGAHNDAPINPLITGFLGLVAMLLVVVVTVTAAHRGFDAFETCSVTYAPPTTTTEALALEEATSPTVTTPLPDVTLPTTTAAEPLTASDVEWRDVLTPHVATCTTDLSSPPAVALFAALVILGFLAVKAWSRTLASA